MVVLKISSKFRFIQTGIILGLLVASLSALEPHLIWLAEFCGRFGDGCMDTHAFKLFTLPIAYFGIGFYLALFCASFFKSRAPLVWLTMGGFGFELLMIELMIRHHFFCLFCTLNLIVLLLLSGFVFQRNSTWQSISACLFIYALSGFFIQQPARGLSNGTLRSASSDIAAVVADKPILHKEIEAPIAGRLYSLKKDIYLLKHKQLEARIQKRLIELEANNQGISANELSQKIIKNATKVTFTDVDKYYQKNYDRLSGRKESETKIKQQIANYLVKENRTKTMWGYVKPLFEKYNVKDLYQPPKLPTANVDIMNSPSWGPVEAKVTIVEFSDYLCPSCRKAHSITKRIKEKYKGKIRWIFKDYPLKRHRGAAYLAMAARCADEQDKFWEFQDTLFGYKIKDISRNDLLNDAASLNLDVDRFALCLDNRAYLYAVQKDLQDVQSAGVNATPSFIINGKLHPGVPDEQTFSKMIDEALNR